MSAPVATTRKSNGRMADFEPVNLGDHNKIDDVMLATGGYDHTIKFWQAPTGQCLRTLQHTDSQVNALEISPDGHLLAAAGYQSIRMYDAGGVNPNPVVNYEGVSKNVMAVGFQDKGRWMFTGGEDCTVRIWDLRMKNIESQRVYQTKAAVNSAILLPSQQDLAIGDQNGFIHVWNVRSDQSEHFRPEPGASIQCVAVDSEGKQLAAVTNKGTCHIMDLKSGDGGRLTIEPKNKIVAHKRYGLKCRFSPDSSMLATSSADQTARLWNTSNLELISELHVTNQRWVWDIAFSADSQYLVTATSDNVARLWHLPSKQVKQEYIGHQKALTCLAFRDGLIEVS